MKIGIIGYQGAGKDTFAELLVKHLGPDDCKLQNFADPLRKIAESLGFSYGRAWKETEVVRHYACFEERLQQAIEEHLGGLEDNVKATLYAMLLEALVARGHLYAVYAGDNLQISTRVFCQLLGTEAGRATKADIWTSHWLRSVAGYDYGIAADVRFPDEAEVCDVLVHVSRPHCGSKGNHASELQMEALTSRGGYSVFNKGDIVYLDRLAESLSISIKEGWTIYNG